MSLSATRRRFYSEANEIPKNSFQHIEDISLGGDRAPRQADQSSSNQAPLMLFDEELMHLPEPLRTQL